MNKVDIIRMNDGCINGYMDGLMDAFLCIH